MSFQDLYYNLRRNSIQMKILMKRFKGYQPEMKLISLGEPENVLINLGKSCSFSNQIEVNVPEHSDMSEVCEFCDAFHCRNEVNSSKKNIPNAVMMGKFIFQI
ncbi:hypothetical protein AVEN_106630-1 [Araneus ventricosus]|uniref:Uncharacterized protein n=1 Tax=Araneus ventricosus TaxID=182803 RepID=A0A4Y2NBS4_ARAVE|nr:hypothetical protein AVEN_106630-1 [Araneus ventricosus]